MPTSKLDRRCVLTLVIGGSAAALLSPRPVAASDEQMAEAMTRVLGQTKPKQGRVAIDIPPLAENGNSVPLTVTVESPMTAADHVKSIYLFSPVNPAPDIAHFHIGPRSGVSRVQTSIRLANTQTISAVAVMSDGSAWMQTAEVIVTLSACIDAG